MSKSSAVQRLRVGAVAYDPKVVTIWEGFKEYFAKHDVEIDYVLYSTYDAQVDANLSGAVDVAWNSPLAWVKSQIIRRGACRAIAMRDSDRDLTTKIIARANSTLATLTDLKGKTLAVGASDSPQATLIPLGMVAESGVDPRRDCRVIYHNVMVGKHGDHVGGERDAAKALASGAADAACVLDANYSVFINEGTLDPERRVYSLPLRPSTTAISPREPTCQNIASSHFWMRCWACRFKIWRCASSWKWKD